MKVALNTQSAQLQKTGLGHYVSKLLEYMPKVASDITYLEIAPRTAKKDLTTPQRFLWDQFGFPAQTVGKGVDLLHQPSFSAPILYPGPQVVCIHDLIPLRFPANLSTPSRLLFNTVMPFSYRFADHYITISEHSKRDIIELLGLPEEKITVTPLAASEQFAPISTAAGRQKLEAVRKKYSLPDSYLLSLATLEPRKNFAFLVRAFAAARKLSPKIAATTLVVTGKKGWGYEALFKEVVDLGLEKHLLFTGYVADEDLPYLYNGAEAFLFPSLYEGFGLPVIEAMRSGCPVVSSDTSSLPEVVGESGLLVDPTDEAAWAKSIVEIVTNDKLRQRFAKESHQRALTFTWEDTARKTADVYRAVAASHRR